MAYPPFVAFPSIMILKSDLELTVTWADIHSGLAVLRLVADITQICNEKMLENPRKFFNYEIILYVY